VQVVIIMSDMKRLHALIEKGNFEWLEEYREQNGISLAEAVRRAINAFRYSESKRSSMPEIKHTGIPFPIDSPTKDEDSPEGMQQRVMNLEIALFKVISHAKNPSEIPSSELYNFVPKYLKL